MNWTFEEEQRFTELKLRELDNLLKPEEKNELQRLRAQVSKVEDKVLNPILGKLEQENADLQSFLTDLTKENHELLALSQRQTRLIEDTKKWIAEFESRYALIQNDFVRLTQDLSAS